MNRRRLLKYLGLGGLVAVGGSFFATRPLSANPYYQGPPSDHFDGTVFFNPQGTPPGKLSDLLKWQLNGERAKWPERFDSPYHGAKPSASAPGKSIEVTHIGHATFLIQTNGLNFLTDPVWSERASPVSFAGPKRINPPGVTFDDLPKIDAVLLTHNHYDHMDIETLERLVKRDDALIITPLGNDTIVKNAIPSARTQTGDWGDVYEMPSGT